MKNQALFSSKDKNKKNNMSSAAILFGTLRVKIFGTVIYSGDSRRFYGTNWITIGLHF